jgi:pyruvate carboxylase
MNNDENFNKLEIDSTNYETRLTRKFLNRKPYVKFTAFIPGVIKRLFVHEDSIVNPGTPLLLLEAMKMENTVNSSVIGKVKKIYIREGELVIKNQLLIELE